MDVRLIDLPTTVRSFVVRKDGTETIVINARLSRERQLECYRHEKTHIHRGDMESSGDVDLVESMTHNKSPRRQEE